MDVPDSTSSSSPPELKSSPSSSLLEDVAPLLIKVRTLVFGQSTLVARCQGAPLLYGHTEEYIKQLVDEYCKFLLLKAYAKDTNAKHLSPTGPVDLVWNLALLDTKSYQSVCKALSLSFIHNDPDDCRHAQAQKKRYENLHYLYFQVFGVLPPIQYWGKCAIEPTTLYSQEQQVVFGKEHIITIECGHLECQCHTKVQHTVTFRLCKAQHINLFWREHEKADNKHALQASNDVVDSILAHFPVPFQPLVLERLGMTSKRRRCYFYRDAIPKYLDALITCPEHNIDRMNEHDSDVVTIAIQGALVGKKIAQLSVLSTFSILHVKCLIRKEVSGHAVDSQVLTFHGKTLENHLTIAECGIDANDEEDPTLHLVVSSL